MKSIKETNNSLVIWIRVLYYNLFYVVYYDTEYKGFFVKRRFIMWLPVVLIQLPFTFVISLLQSIIDIQNHPIRWLAEDSNRKFSLIEKAGIILKLKP